MTRLRAVTFDVGGTLIDPWPSVGDVYAEVAREFGLQCHAEQLNAGFSKAWRGRSGFGYSRLEWFEVVRQSFNGSGEVSPVMFDAIWHRFGERRCWLIYEDVLPVLEAIESRGLKLGVISNWDERLVPLLERLGLAACFDQITVSIAVGAHKPDRLIFEAAAQALSVSPSDILHIGDSENEDVEGARSAGFRALRIRRSGPTHDHEIGCLTDALHNLT
jgi:putative hydrolase of the HAD superfamily